ncbi:Myo-inositol 2-dehydrogenase [Microbacterium esteraromaticum]|uniref:Myo-inositol 2-dehydrogenase n=1 Tax=Microbacterium esteraromaticum TaxID=57043 RepID=A0A1R4K0R1_9MICO|nr:Gfo/Idh/MocA family oxidoreductase [Microbacterium esteraromaticum]SJN37754.1 Myo-inositol 2-dehydrogenase [Microbacterium esteraromaticum]
MRIGVIGLGRMGMAHAANLAHHPGVDTVVLFGRDPGRVDAAASALTESPSRTGEVEVAAGGVETAITGLDGLVVATTTATHSQFARLAAHSGVPSLVEKPLALDLDELTALSAELDALDAPVMVGFHRRYDTGYRRLRQRVEEGDAGTLRLVRGTSHDHRPLPLGYIPVSGGVWRDLLIHDFDIVPWITGERVVAVEAFASVLDEPEYARHGDADTAVAVLTLESGAFAVLSGTRRNGAGQDVRTEVYGTRGTFEAGLDSRTPVVSTEPGVEPPSATHDDFTDRFASAFRNEIDHFVRMASGEAGNLTPPGEGLSSLRIAMAAEESVRSGRQVALR